MAFKPLDLENVSRETFKYTLQPRGCGKMYDEYTKEQVKLHYLYLTGKSLYCDTDSIKVKENDMERLNIKDFIVLHKSGLPCLIKKSCIITIEKNTDGTTTIWVDKYGDYVDDNYDDVIKRLFT